MCCGMAEGCWLAGAPHRPSLPLPLQCGGRARKSGARYLLLMRDDAEDGRTRKLIG